MQDPSKFNFTLISKKRLYISIPIFLTLFWATINWASLVPDYYDYLQVARYFWGYEIDYTLSDLIFLDRLMRPVIPFLAGLLGFFLRFEILPIWDWKYSDSYVHDYLYQPVNLGIINGYALISLFSILLSMIIFYKYIEKHFNESTALIGTILFSCSYPIVAYSSGIFLDPEGILFVLITIWFIEYYFEKTDENERVMTNTLLLILLIVFSTLIKEQVGIIALFLLIIQMLRKDRYKNKKSIFLFLTICASVAIIINLIFFLLGTSIFVILDLHDELGVLYSSTTWGLFYYIGTLSAFHVLVLFFMILGFLDDNNEERRRHFMLTAIPLFISTILVFHMEARYTFLLFPVVYPYASKGIIYTAESFANLISYQTSSRLFSFVNISKIAKTFLTFFTCFILIFAMIHVRLAFNNPLLMSEYPPPHPEPAGTYPGTYNIPIVIERITKMSIYMSLVIVIFFLLIITYELKLKELNISKRFMSLLNSKKRFVR